MSFIYDDNVYLDIIGRALIKEAQNIPLNPTLVAKKLSGRLQRQITNTPEPPNISSTSEIGLSVNDLQNLGKLMQFLARNGVKLDGTRIAYSGEENDKLPEAEQNKLSPITINLSRDAATRKWNTVDYYANLPLLIKYVSYLQQKANTMKVAGEPQGRILEVLVGKLIDSVNMIKPDSGLSRKPKSTPDKPRELPDETVLDSFGSKVFDTKNPYADSGALKLLAKDLKSKESLNTWMRGGGMFGPEAQIASYDANNQKTQTPYTNPQSNLCVVINVLYLRAQRSLQLAKTPEETAVYTYFVNKVREIGPTFTDPNGQACNIGGATAQYGLVGQPGTQVGVQGPGGARMDQVLEQLVQALPLDTQDIDFHRILAFANLYQPLVSTLYAGEVGNAIVNLGVAMQRATSLTISGQKNFRMTRNIQEVNSWVKDPKGPNAVAMVNFLQQAIIETGKIIQIFYNEYGRTTYSGDRKVFNSEQKSLVEGQILGNSSIYYQNLRDLQALKANILAWIDKAK
jgi:hypothetical protein